MVYAFIVAKDKVVLEATDIDQILHYKAKTKAKRVISGGHGAFYSVELYNVGVSLRFQHRKGWNLSPGIPIMISWIETTQSQ
jgi:hypothetical protein